jgi:hypothetical protein
METVLIILGGIGGTLLGLGYVFFLMHVYYVHVRNKGYLSPLIALGFWAIIALAFFVGVFGLIHSTDNVNYGALFLTGSMVLTTAGLYIGAKLLPPKPRVAGARKVLFPYRLAAWVLLAAGVGQFLFVGFSSHWKSPLVNSSGKFLWFFALPGCFYCLYIAKRSQAPSADEVLDVDHRPPVLYLRAFTYEEQRFVILPNKEAAKYSSYLGTKCGVTLEQYFASAIRESIGPFVALGNPLDYAPPEGASREYERDENWKDYFLDQARRAACIIIQAGDSRNLQWEFEALKLEGLQEKVFIFTPPMKKLGAMSSLWGYCQPWSRLTRQAVRFEQRIKGAKPAMWSEFAAGMCGAGYEIDATEPSPGSVISFTHEGPAILLGTGAQDPSDFVTIMLERLQSLSSDCDDLACGVASGGEAKS